MSNVSGDSLAIVELVKQSGKAWTKADIVRKLKLSQRGWSEGSKFALEAGALFRAQAGGPPTTRFASKRSVAVAASNDAQARWSKYLVKAIAKKRDSRANGHIKEETTESRERLRKQLNVVNGFLVDESKKTLKIAASNVYGQPKRALPVKRETREHVSCPFCQGELIL